MILRTRISLAAAAGAALLCGVGLCNAGTSSLPAGSDAAQRPDRSASNVLRMIASTELSDAEREAGKTSNVLRMIASPDSIEAEEERAVRFTSLTDRDFRKVADQLGVEVAAIRAVVEIEAGQSMKGFWAPGVPVINFDSKMYARFKGKVACKGCVDNVPDGLSGYALQEWKQLVNARRSNSDAANMGTFWGMFQIGGFNYRQCGCQSVEEFVSMMSYSELEQLELFAAFITNTGMLPDLKARDWAAFARKYNGASYAKRGYHKRMAEAYARYKKQEK